MTAADTPATARARGAAWTGWAIWTAGLAVACAAAAATAHGLYEVADAAGNPPLIAALYPLITDGLALVAYAATTRLTDGGRGYAWTIVILAAGLSGLAQAAYLGDTVHTAPGWLRAGVGAWPALAAAIVAHLLYLLAAARRMDMDSVQPATSTVQAVQPYNGVQSHPARTDGAASNGHHSQTNRHPGRVDPLRLASTLTMPSLDAVDGSPGGGTESVNPVHSVQPSVRVEPAPPVNGQPHPSDSGRTHGRPEQPAGTAPTDGLAGTARDRAQRVAADYEAAHGEFPTVNKLAQLADVARGTAGNALKQLRESERS